MLLGYILLKHLGFTLHGLEIGIFGDLITLAQPLFHVKFEFTCSYFIWVISTQLTELPQYSLVVGHAAKAVGLSPISGGKVPLKRMQLPSDAVCAACCVFLLYL